MEAEETNASIATAREGYSSTPISKLVAALLRDRRPLEHIAQSLC